MSRTTAKRGKQWEASRKAAKSHIRKKNAPTGPSMSGTARRRKTPGARAAKARDAKTGKRDGWQGKYD